MEGQESFDNIKEKFITADLTEKIRLYTSIQGLSVEQYKELLKYFPIKHLGELEKAMG